MIPSKDASGGIGIPFRVPIRDCLSLNWVGGISLGEFILTCPRLVPDSPVLLREKSENHINVTEGKDVRLGNMLEFFIKMEEFSVSPQSLLFKSVCLMRRGCEL